MTLAELERHVRTVPDFPKPGIQFRDITTLLSHGEALAASVALLAERARAHHAELIAGIEARGFIFGTAVAVELGLGFVPVRKPGKLPVPTIAVDYALEYGTDRLELDPGAVPPGTRVVLVDDLIATGGTALAATDLLRRTGAQVAAALFAIDLPDLGGAQRLRAEAVPVDALMTFPGD